MTTTPLTMHQRELIESRLIDSPVAQHLGIRLSSVERFRPVLELPFSFANVTIGDVVHGGVIATLADVAGVASAIAAAAELPTGGATVSMAISYLAPAADASLRASGTVLRAGRRQTVVRVTIATDQGTAIAEALVTVMLA